MSGGAADWDVTLNSPRNGLFAHLTWCLALWAKAESARRRLTVRAVSPQYGATDGSVDWFGALFLNRLPAPTDPPPLALTLREFEEWPGFERGDGSGSLAEAAGLFRRYSGLHPSIAGEADQFCRRTWGDAPVLGVHYRGTDKGTEALPVSAAAMIAQIREAVDQWPGLEMLYLATDEADFPRALRAALPRLQVVCGDGFLRSGGGRAVHHLPATDGMRRAREAVFDCAVLSRTSLLLKTASMLSGWSAVLNPGLPVVVVNPPRAHANFFPDRVLLRSLAELPDVIAGARRGN
jgi:hypothetical protein